MPFAVVEIADDAAGHDVLLRLGHGQAVWLEHPGLAHIVPADEELMAVAGPPAPGQRGALFIVRREQPGAGPPRLCPERVIHAPSPAAKPAASPSA